MLWGLPVSLGRVKFDSVIDSFGILLDQHTVATLHIQPLLALDIIRYNIHSVGWSKLVLALSPSSSFP